MPRGSGDTTRTTAEDASTDASSFNPADREARFGEISKHLNQVVVQADVRPRTASERESRKSRYGRMAPQAADATIEMVQGARKPFDGLTRAGRTVEQRLQKNAAKSAFLEGVLGKLNDVTVMVQGELNGTNNEALSDVEDCRQTMVATLGNPAARGPEQDQLFHSSTKFRGLIDVRNQAYQNSRDNAGGLRDEVKAKESEVADLGVTVAQKDIELKYHTGGELTPDDVVIAARPIAAPAAPTAPRQSRTRGATSEDAGPRPAGGRRRTSR